MYNDLFSVGPFTVHGYGLMIGLGFLCCLLLCAHRAKKRGLSEDAVYSIGILVLVCGFAGSKLLYVLTEWDVFLTDPLSVLGSEGFVVYGGLLAGAFSAWVYILRRHESFRLWGDTIIPGVALAQGFGRIGCFLAGCCYGRPTDSCIGVVFPAGSMAPAGIALLPTQLFSAAGDLLITAVLLLLDRKKHARGMLLVWYLLLYGAGRFIIEFFRDDPRGAVGALSTSQFISLFSLAAAAAVALLIKKRSRNDET